MYYFFLNGNKATFSIVSSSFFGTRFGLSDSSAVCRRNVQQYSTLRTVDRRVTWLLDKRKKRPRAGNFGKLLLLFFLQLFIIDFPCMCVWERIQRQRHSLLLIYYIKPVVFAMRSQKYMYWHPRVQDVSFRQCLFFYC